MRFLCLHGMGTNGKIFEVQTAKIRLGIGGDHEYIWVDGTVPIAPAPGVKEIASPDDEFLTFSEEDDIDGILKLSDDMIAFVKAEGPFDAVMAFSGGAAVAASMIVAYLRSSSVHEYSLFSFKCAVFFCAGNPVDAADAQKRILRKLSFETDGRVITIPTAHVWTRNDDVHPGFGETLGALCAEDVKEEYIHDLGHTIPGAQSDDGVFETVRAIRRTIERAESSHE